MHPPHAPTNRQIVGTLLLRPPVAFARCAFESPVRESGEPGLVSHPPGGTAVILGALTGRGISMLRNALLLAALCVAAAAPAQTPPPDLTLTQVIAPGSLSSPLAVRNAGDGSGRIFIVQKGGAIAVYKNGALLPTPLLTMTVCSTSEQGLLGLAFHPDYDGVTERRFYVSYTATAANCSSTSPAPPQRVAEFQTQVGNPDIADPASRREVIEVADLRGNHNGGDIVFGPDGYLYWSMGDSGVQNDPNGFAQCLWKKPEDGNPANCTPGAGANYFLLGKIIRIDPTQTTASASSEMCAATAGQPAGYRIPPDNPFVGSSNTCDEIMHFGMRNPWRVSFDKVTGDFFIADVGQNTWEEVTFLPAGSKGVNLGWRCFEGTNVFSTAAPCNVPLLNYLPPFQTYQHLSSRCSITGGYRYRGPIGALRGTYINADYCTGELYFSVRASSGSWSPGLTQVNVWQDTPYNIAGLGEDEVGNVYVTNISSGAVYVFTSASDNSAIFEHGFEG
jgi:glucose/arabinose dehydrogenase